VATVSFRTAEDIANLALQIVGATRIQSLAEGSRNAAEVAACYDKLRDAELRRHLWRFATRVCPLCPVDTSTMLLVPPVWSASTTYFPGAIVMDSLGNWWMTGVDNNLGNQPGSDTDFTWEIYFGPMTAEAYQAPGSSTISGRGYFSSQVVYKTDGFGNVRVFNSLTTSNTDGPDVPISWSPTATYAAGQVVFGGDGWYYMSLFDLNTGTAPTQVISLQWWSGTGPTLPFARKPWQIGITYAAGDTAGALDGLIYQSNASGNVGYNPTSSPTKWTPVGRKNAWTPCFIGGLGADTWHLLNATLAPLNLIYPIGTGPLSQSSSRNIYRLPNGWLREAPQDPKAGSASFLGAPTGRQYNDWTYQGDYFTTGDASSPILYRFVADVQQVPKMDPLFCKALAASIATIICEPLTQSNGKLQMAASEYARALDDAGTVDGIERGPTEPPIDDWIATRA
jgi:hypothetical protein